jgi:hypothetical protein
VSGLAVGLGHRELDTPFSPSVFAERVRELLAAHGD